MNNKFSLLTSVFLGIAILSLFFIIPIYLKFNRTILVTIYISIIALIGSFPVLLRYLKIKTILDNWDAFWSGFIVTFIVAAVTFIIFALSSWWSYSKIDLSFTWNNKENFAFITLTVSMTFSVIGAFGAMIINSVLYFLRRL